MRLPKIGQWYKHNSTGAIYTVECIANLNADSDREDEYPITVVYKSIDTTVWSRPIEKWEGKFTELGSDGEDSR